jgi:hypothetical protein
MDLALMRGVALAEPLHIDRDDCVMHRRSLRLFLPQ